MKQDETLFKAKKRYIAIMVASFLYGGFSLILFLYNTYSFFWRSEAMPNGPIRGPGRMTQDPMLFLSSPQNIIYPLGGLLAIIAGLTIWSLIREKELKAVKQETAKKLLLPDEKAVINALKNAGSELTQSKIAMETGLNKVQVHRAVKRLELKGAIEKHGYGLTNKIILKKDFLE